MDERSSGVYSFRCLVNDKRYIGSGYLDQRYASHNKLLNTGTHFNQYFQRAWDKYGEAAFEYAVIEECARELLAERETFWILYHRSAERGFGYNISFPVRQRVPAEGKTLIHKAIMARPGMRDRVSHGVKKYHDAHPENKATLGEGAKRYFADPDNNKKRSEQSKALWRDENMRAQLMASQQAAKSTPEFRQRMSEVKTRQMAEDPTIREKVSRSRKAQYQNDPEYVARVMAAAADPVRNKAISDKAKARWADPEYKARVGAAISTAKRAKTP
jgi:group I intron endonuclease